MGRGKGKGREKGGSHRDSWGMKEKRRGGHGGRIAETIGDTLLCFQSNVSFRAMLVSEQC